MNCIIGYIFDISLGAIRVSGSDEFVKILKCFDHFSIEKRSQKRIRLLFIRCMFLGCCRDIFFGLHMCNNASIEKRYTQNSLHSTVIITLCVESTIIFLTVVRLWKSDKKRKKRVASEMYGRQENRVWICYTYIVFAFYSWSSNSCTWICMAAQCAFVQLFYRFLFSFRLNSPDQF